MYRSKAIRAFCLECMGYYLKEINKCESRHCPLWPYRKNDISWKNYEWVKGEARKGAIYPKSLKNFVGVWKKKTND